MECTYYSVHRGVRVANLKPQTRRVPSVHGMYHTYSVYFEVRIKGLTSIFFISGGQDRVQQLAPPRCFDRGYLIQRRFRSIAVHNHAVEHLGTGEGRQRREQCGAVVMWGPQTKTLME